MYQTHDFQVDSSSRGMPDNKKADWLAQLERWPATTLYQLWGEDHGAQDTDEA